MLLPRNQVDDFCSFVEKRLGIKLGGRTQKQHDITGELKRGLIGPRLLLIRELTPPPYSQLGESVEVFSPDQKFLRELEDNWNLNLYASMKEP